MRPHILITTKGRLAGVEPPDWQSLLVDRGLETEAFIPSVEKVMRRHGLEFLTTQEYMPAGTGWSSDEIASGLDRVYRLILTRSRHIPPNLIADLRLLPEVIRVASGGIGQMHLNPRSRMLGTGTGKNSRDSIFLSEAQQFTEGDAAITVAVLDTGISPIVSKPAAVSTTGNTAPVANDDTASTDENSPVTIDVLANDRDADGDSIRIKRVNSTSYKGGSVVNSWDGRVTYTPKTGFSGRDSFKYAVTDGQATVTATVRITVSESFKVTSTTSGGSSGGSVSGAKTLFEDDFEGGTVGKRPPAKYYEADNHWGICSGNCVTISDDEASQGRKSIKAYIHKNRSEVPFRSEASPRGLPDLKHGDELWYGVDILVPSDHAPDFGSGDTVVQWHHYGDGNGGLPPLSLKIMGKRWVLVDRSGPSATKNVTEAAYDLGPITPGRWVSWKFRIRWSHRSDGILEVWKDGNKVVDEPGANTYPDSRDRVPFVKIGVYKPSWRPQAAGEWGGDPNIVERLFYLDDFWMMQK